VNWLLGQPFVVLAAGVAVVIVLYGVLQQTGKRWVLFVMLAAALLTAGLVVLERMIVTPEEAVKATLYAVARDVQRNDIDAVVSHISRRAPDIQQLARTQLQPVTMEEVKVKRISQLVAQPTGRPPTASAVVQVLAVRGDRSGTFQHRRGVFEFRVDFVEEDGWWRIRHYEQIESDFPSPR
jgi:hypothetical protein